MYENIFITTIFFNSYVDGREQVVDAFFYSFLKFALINGWYKKDKKRY